MDQIQFAEAQESEEPGVGGIQSLTIFMQSTKSTTALYRLNMPNQDHLYTTDKNEADSLKALGWKDEGIEAYLFYPRVIYNGVESIPLYRSFHPVGDHFYTADRQEWITASTSGWKPEGIIGHIFATQVPDSIPLYRSWHLGIADHFYTTDKAEYDAAVSFGYSKEGIVGYVFPTKKTYSVEIPVSTSNPKWKFCVEKMTVDQLINSGLYNVVDNRNGFLFNIVTGADARSPPRRSRPRA